jgi:hypothetical protein
MIGAWLHTQAFKGHLTLSLIQISTVSGPMKKGVSDSKSIVAIFPDAPKRTLPLGLGLRW